MTDSARDTAPERTGRKWWRFGWRLLSVVVTVALLYVVLDQLQGIDLRQVVASVPAATWLAALGIYLALNLLRAARFRILLDKRDTPWRLLIPITLYHNGLVRVVPFKLGELSYVVLLRTRLNYSMQEGVGSLFGSRILEMLIIVSVFATGILLGGEAFAAQRDELILLLPDGLPGDIGRHLFRWRSHPGAAAPAA